MLCLISLYAIISFKLDLLRTIPASLKITSLTIFIWNHFFRIIKGTMYLVTGPSFCPASWAPSSAKKAFHNTEPSFCFTTPSKLCRPNDLSSIEKSSTIWSKSCCLICFKFGQFITDMLYRLDLHCKKIFPAWYICNTSSVQTLAKRSTNIIPTGPTRSSRWRRHSSVGEGSVGDEDLEEVDRPRLEEAAREHARDAAHGKRDGTNQNSFEHK